MYSVLTANLIQAMPTITNEKLNVKDKKVYMTSTVFSTGFTSGAFSQQYFKYLKTDYITFLFFEIPIKEYEYSVVRCNYYLPSIGISRTYSTKAYKGIDVGVDFQPGFVNLKNSIKMLCIVTPHFNLNNITIRKSE